MSAPDKTGGQAFPSSNTVGEITVLRDGMTLRDYFAGQALAGVVGSNETMASVKMLADKYNKSNSEMVAQVTYAFADAMIKERSK